MLYAGLLVYPPSQLDLATAGTPLCRNEGNDLFGLKWSGLELESTPVQITCSLEVKEQYARPCAYCTYQRSPEGLIYEISHGEEFGRPYLPPRRQIP